MAKDYSDSVPKIRYILMGLCVVMASTVCMASLVAQHDKTDHIRAVRDADGTRLQARKFNVGETQKDSLSPPEDAADWYYLRIDKASVLSIVVTTAEKDMDISLLLTNASGEDVLRGVSQQGRLSMRERLNSGIYYLSISSTTAARYKLDTSTSE